MSYYEIHKAKDDAFYYLHVADNGEVLSTSETYSRKQDAYRGVEDASTVEAVEIKDCTDDAGR